MRWNPFSTEKRDLEKDLKALFNWFINGLMKIHWGKPHSCPDP